MKVDLSLPPREQLLASLLTEDLFGKLVYALIYKSLLSENLNRTFENIIANV